MCFPRVSVHLPCLPTLTLLAVLLPACRGQATSILDIQLPRAPSSPFIVHSNFLGVSIELSSLDQYIGPSPTDVPTTVVNYFSNLRPASGRPMRLRVGGNSVDSSSFAPNQTQMISFLGNSTSPDNIACTFGPTLFDTIKAFSTAIGSAQIMMGLSLLDPSNANTTILAAYAENALGSNLDAFLLGNEPDLYAPHGDRPSLSNYTTQDYFKDLNTTENLLRSYPKGNLLASQLLGGPSICCQWDLNTLINDGYLNLFSDQLKYIILQHYPQNNCFPPPYGIDYYLQHQYVVQLAGWQSAGVNSCVKASKSVVMAEFNTASCGGIPGLSNTFAASLWTVDYTLQLASVGYTAAYIHTREANVTYSLFKSDGRLNGTWTTQPSYYGLLPIVAALTPSESGSGGSTVIDLNLNSSTTANSSAAGYAIYDQDSPDPNPNRLVLFNYGLSGDLTFNVETSTFGSTPLKSVNISYLTAPSVSEPINISWTGQTLAGAGDGRFVTAPPEFASANVSMDCDKQCQIIIKGPGLALVWLERSKTSFAWRTLPFATDVLRWYTMLFAFTVLHVVLG